MNPGWDEVIARNDSRSCGPRCSRVYVFQFADRNNTVWESGHFFNCTISISKVEGGSPNQPFHQLPDQTATIAAGAIGMDGFSDNMRRQFVRYTDAVIWGARTNGSVHRIEDTVGRFAAGVIAAYDVYGPKVEISGIQKHPGVILEVSWGYVVCVFAHFLRGSCADGRVCEEFDIGYNPRSTVVSRGVFCLLRQCCTLQRRFAPN